MSTEINTKQKKPLATYGKSKRQGLTANMKSDDLADWDEFTSKPAVATASKLTATSKPAQKTTAAESKSPSPLSHEETSDIAPTKKAAAAPTAQPKSKVTKKTTSTTTTKKTATTKRAETTRGSKPTNGATAKQDTKDIFDVPDYSDEDEVVVPKPRKRAAAAKTTTKAKGVTKPAPKARGVGSKTLSAKDKNNKLAKGDTKPSDQSADDKSVKSSSRKDEASPNASGPEHYDMPSNSAGSPQSAPSPAATDNSQAPRKNVRTAEKAKPINPKPTKTKLSELIPPATTTGRQQTAASLLTTAEQIKANTSKTKTSVDGEPKPADPKQVKPPGINLAKASAVKKVAPSEPKKASESKQVKPPESNRDKPPETKLAKGKTLAAAKPATSKAVEPEESQKKKRRTATDTAAPNPSNKARRVGKRVEQLKEREKEELESEPRTASKRRSPTVEEDEIAARPKISPKPRKTSPTSNKDIEMSTRNIVSPKPRQKTPISEEQTTIPEKKPVPKKAVTGVRQSLANLIDELARPKEEGEQPQKKKRMIGRLQANPNSKRHSSSEEKTPPRIMEGVRASQTPSPTKINNGQGTPSQSQGSSQMPLILPPPDQYIPIRKTGVVATYGRQRSYREEEDDGRDPFLVSLLPAPRAPSPEEEEGVDKSKKLKSKFELREAGNNKRFLDEMEECVSDVQSKEIRIRRSGLMEIARKVNDKTFVRRFAANNFDARLFADLRSQNDVIARFNLAFMLAVFIEQDPTARTIELLVENGGVPMLLDMLDSSEDICDIAKDKASKIPKLTQSLVADIRQVVSENRGFADYEATVISPRLVALKVLEQFVIKMRGAGVYKDILPDSDLGNLVQIMKPFAESKDVPAASDLVFIELPASIMEKYLVYNRKPLTEQFSAEEIGILVNLFGSVMQWSSDSPDFAYRILDVQHTILALTINFVTENYDASTLFVGSEGIIHTLVTTIVRTFGIISSNPDDDEDDHSLEIDNLILCMGMLQNFSKITYNIVRVIQDTTVSNKNALEALTDVFADRSQKIEEASTQRESLQNIPVGHLAVTLAYFCRDRDLRAVIREKTGGGSLKPLTATLEKFYTVYRLAMTSDEAGAGEHFADEMEALVSDMQVLN